MEEDQAFSVATTATTTYNPISAATTNSLCEYDQVNIFNAGPPQPQQAPLFSCAAAMGCEDELAGLLTDFTRPGSLQMSTGGTTMHNLATLTSFQNQHQHQQLAADVHSSSALPSLVAAQQPMPALAPISAPVPGPAPSASSARTPATKPQRLLRASPARRDSFHSQGSSQSQQTSGGHGSPSLPLATAPHTSTGRIPLCMVLPCPVIVSREEATANRAERVRKYREKKLQLSFKKTIRYASRKTYAETRIRIRGRFVTKKEIEELRAAGTLPAEFMDA
jgi:hypothetical protein